MKIVRKELTPADMEPVTIRYNVDCSCVQSLVGGTWVDNPPADPRTSTTYQYPAPATADPACDAGARIAAAVERIISTVFDAVSVIEAVSTMIGVVAVFFPPIALFVVLLFALISAANAIGFAAVQLAFTDTVYEQIACLVFCSIGADGQFNAEEWNNFQDDVGTTFGLSTVTAILSLMFEAMGMVAFNNMAAAGTETGICVDCGCDWCYQWDTNADLAAEGAVHAYDTDQSQFWTLTTTTFTLVRARFDFCEGGGSGAASAVWSTDAFGTIWQLFTPTVAGCYTYDSDDADPNPSPVATSGGISWGANSGAPTVPPASTTGLIINGSGTMPAWTHGHTC